MTLCRRGHFAGRTSDRHLEVVEALRLWSHVEMTISGRKIVVEGGHCTLVDEEKAEAQATAGRLMSVTGLEALRKGRSGAG